MGATSYSTSGYYKNALECWDKNGAGVKTLTVEDSSWFSSFKPRNAQEYIIERSKKETVIIINEAHHNASHRTFTRSLLEGLYNNGYRFLGLEALSDTLINGRGIPVMKSGYYIKEPEFGNLLSEALKIGFTLFEYEASEGKNGNEREMEQAENIAKIMGKNPQGKFLIHCGYDHAIEGVHRGWGKAMAGRLKEYTKIDPFTIDQVQYSEKGSEKYNSPYIAMINQEYPVIMVDEKGKTFNGSKDSDQTDCRIIHPVSKYNFNRPTWLLSNGKKKWYKLPESKITDLPVLVFAYRIDEFDQNGVPCDIIEITQINNPGHLALSPGNYEIIIKDKNYNIIGRYQEEIK